MAGTTIGSTYLTLPDNTTYSTRTPVRADARTGNGASSMILDNIPSDARIIWITLRDISWATANQSILRFRFSGTDNSSANYNWSGTTIIGTGYDSSSAVGDTSFYLTAGASAPAAAAALSGLIQITRLGNTDYKYLISSQLGNSASTGRIIMVDGSFTTSVGALTGVRILGLNGSYLMDGGIATLSYV